MSSTSSNSSMESMRSKRPRLLEEVTVGKYKIKRTIGNGQYTKVMLAYHMWTREKVAIKRIEKLPLKAGGVRRLFREAKMMKKLNHPNIIKLIDVFDSHEYLYLVMEYASGGDLFTYLQDHDCLNEFEARQMFRQIVSAVEYCHQKRIIHRDLKEENILLDSKMNIKLADFGLSNILEPGSKFQTYCGTVECMAPEIILGKKYGPEVDVWSLGILLHILLSKKSPFSASTKQDVKKRILSCCYEIPYFVSTDYEKLLTKILVFAPEKRPTLRTIMEDKWINYGHQNGLEPYVEPEEEEDDPEG